MNLMNLTKNITFLHFSVPACQYMRGFIELAFIVTIQSYKVCFCDRPSWWKQWIYVICNNNVVGEQFTITRPQPAAEKISLPTQKLFITQLEIISAAHLINCCY